MKSNQSKAFEMNEIIGFHFRVGNDDIIYTDQYKVKIKFT